MVSIGLINNTNSSYPAGYSAFSSNLNANKDQKDQDESNPQQSLVSQIAHTVFSLEGVFMGWWFYHLANKAGESLHFKFPKIIPQISKFYPVIGIVAGLGLGAILHEIINDTKNTFQQILDKNTKPGFLHTLGQLGVNALASLLISTIILIKKVFSIISAKHDPKFASEYIKFLHKIEDLYIKAMNKLGVKELSSITREKESTDVLSELEKMHRNSHRAEEFLRSSGGLTFVNKFGAKSLNYGYKLFTDLISFRTWNRERKLNLPVYNEFGKRILLLSAIGLGFEYLLHSTDNLASALFHYIKKEIKDS